MGLHKIYIILGLVFCLALTGCSDVPVVNKLQNVNITGPLETGAVVVIDKSHAETHEGDHYFFKSFIEDTGGAGSVTFFSFTTPNTTTRINARALLAPDVDFLVQIQEGAIITGGTPLEGFNNDRDSSNVAELITTINPIIVNGGTIIWTARNGGGKNPVGVSPGFNYEIIAKSNTTYIFNITKQVVQTGIIDVDFWWYEEHE